MSKGPSRQKYSVSSSASRRYDQSLEHAFNNHNLHSSSGACEHVSNSEKTSEQHRSQRERRHRHHRREHDSSARRHGSSSGESLPEDHYQSTAPRKHTEADSVLSSYLYKSPRKLSKFCDSASKTTHVNRISDHHSASVKSPRTNHTSPPSAHRNRSPTTSVPTARSENRNSTKMAGDSPRHLLRVRPDNRKRSYQDSSSTVGANVASASYKKMNSSGDSNCRGYEHPTTTLDHGTVFTKSNISTKAAKTRDSPSKLHDEPSTVTNVTATNSPAKCLTDNQLRHIPVPTTSPFAYNDPLLFTQVFSKFQQPLSASPPSPSSSFDGSFFGESKIPRRSCKPSDSPSQPAVQSYVPTSSYLGTAVQPLLSTVGGCHPDGHHRSSCSGSNWHHQADDSGVYVPGVDLLPATGCPPSSNHFHTDGVNPVDRRAGRAHSTPSQAEEGDDDHHFAMDLASSPPTRSPQSSPLLPPLFPPLSSGQQQQRHHQQQQQMRQQQQHQQSGNVSVGVLVSSQTSPYPIAATKRSKPDDGRVPTSQELRLEGHAVSPAPTSSMSGPSAGIELSKAAKSHNQRLKQQRSKVLPVKRITLPPLHLHLSEDGSSPLPPGWQRAPNTSRRDSSSANGQSATAADGCNYAYYYYHTRTRQTRWDPPVYPWDADPEDKLERSIDDPEAPYNWGCAHRFAVTHDEIEAMYTQLRSRILERQCMELLHEQAGRPDAPQGAQEQNFAIELYTLVHNELRQFRDARAKLGRITSDEDLYFLTKKLAQSVILKEMQKLHQTQAANSSSLFATSVAEVTPAIRQRASSYVRKYMEAKGPCYRRRAPPQQMPPSVPSQPHHHQQTQNPRARQPRPLPSSGGDDAPRPNIPVSGTMRLAPVLPLPQHHTANAR